MNKFLLKSAFIIFSLLLSANVAEACSCGATPTVLSQVESSKNVFIAKIVSVEKAGAGSSALYGVSGAKMVVQKVYKGNYKIGEEMFFGQGGGADCIWTYDEKSIGDEILIYTAYFKGASKIGIIFGCSRTRHVEAAGDDLLYLDNLAKNNGRSRISGSIDYWDKNTLEGIEPPKKSLEGKLIKITNASTKATYQVKTDKNGVYEIYDLPAGKYNVEVESINGWKTSFLSNTTLDYQELDRLEKKGGKIPEGLKNDDDDDEDDEDDEKEKQISVYLFPNRHAGADFVFEIVNAIKGRIVDPNGNPMKGVNIAAYPIGGKKYEYFSEADYSDEKGEFSIDSLPVGNYALVINADDKLSAAEPFGKFYYPNENQIETAKIISIKEGELIDGIEIKVPKVAETITVEGRVLYADGKPVKEENVSFKESGKQETIEGSSSARTDAEGRFSLKILKGLSGTIYSSMFTYLGEFKNCPSIEKVIKAQGKNQTSINLKTDEIKFQAETNVKNLELKYKVEACLDDSEK